MRFLSLALFFLLALTVVSCGGSSGKNCPDGYSWNDATKQCEKKNGNTVPDEMNEFDQDDSDVILTPDDDDVTPDVDTGPDYNGHCVVIRTGGDYTIDIKTFSVTIDSVTFNNSTDLSSIEGEIWIENKRTLSSEKLSDIGADLQGKTISLAKGIYNFYYRKNIGSDSVPILSDLRVEEDKEIDLPLPLIELDGKIMKNSSSFPSLTGTAASSTKVILSSGSDTYEIPYNSFSSYSLILPADTYDILFEGYFSNSGSLVRGKASRVEITESDDSYNIIIPTVTYSGSIIKRGYTVSSGTIVAVEQPPVSNIAAVVSSSATSSSYSVELVADESASLSIIYLEDESDYPQSYLIVDKWEEFDSNKSQSITLDFAKLTGTLNFGSTGEFTPRQNCVHSDITCSVGKLKASNLSAGNILIKDFGPTGSDRTFEAILVRGTDTGEQYISKIYDIVFESYLNDGTDFNKYLPFEIMVEEGFSFKSGDSAVTQKDLTVDINPKKISGSILLDNAAFSQSNGEDILLLQDRTTFTEVPVINFSDLSDNNFEILVPEGSYDIIYKGNSVFGSEQKAVIEAAFDVKSNIADHDIKMMTGKITLNLTVNGSPLKDYLQNESSLTRYNATILPSNSATAYTAEIKTDQEIPYFKVFLYNTWNVYLSLYTESDDKENSFLFPVGDELLAGPVRNDITVTDEYTIIPIFAHLLNNGAEMGSENDYRGFLKVTGKYRYKAYIPKSGSDKAPLLFHEGEYATPDPEITLNSGFDFGHDINLDCIYVGK